MSYITNAIDNILTSFDFQALIEEVLIDIFRILIIVFLLWILRKILKKIITSYFSNQRHFIFEKSARNDTIQRLLLNALQYSYYFFIAYSVLSILGVPVSTLIAGAGIASLAVGLGAKDLVTDIVNGLFILLEHQYNVGDHVEINGYEGVVSRVGVRTTIIRDYDGIHHFIPNGKIQALSNLSMDSVRIEVNLLVPTDINFDEYVDIIKTAYESEAMKDNQIDQENTDFIGVFQDSHGRFIYKVRIWAKTPDDTVEVEGHYYQLFTNALNDAGYTVPMSALSQMDNIVHFEDNLEKNG